MKTKLLLSIFPLLLFLLAFTPGAEAANQTVANLGDSGLSSQLRQKIALCQSGASPGGTITFSVAGNVTLDATKGPLPTIASNVTIDGGGKIEISGNTAMRVFNVASGASLTLRNLTISNASSSSDDGGAIASTGTLNAQNTKFLNNTTSSSWSGSAILSWGPLNLTGCEFGFNSGGGGAVKPRSSGATTTITGCNFHDNESSNSAGGGYGGAIQVFDGPSVSIHDSTFTNNRAGQQGGAIYITSNCEVAIYTSTLNGNSAFSYGGAIYNSGAASVSLTDVTVSGNSATDAGGGGMFNNGTATIRNVTFSGNTAPTGGGIRNGNWAGLTNVTLSGNSATDNPGGGAIYNSDTAVLTNVTLSGNSSPGVGGISSLGTITIINTVIAKGASGGNCSTFPSYTIGGDLSDDNTCGFTAAMEGIQRDNITDLLLGPLANNGGLTKTHLPQVGSPALDNGIAEGAPPTDQRGVERPQGPAADVGAVEVPLQVFENTDPSLQLGGWSGTGSPNANGGFFRWSNLTNTAVTYKFNATSIKWITAKGPTMGKALVTIDGVSKGTFDLYRSSMLWNQQILFSGLSSAAHTIAIKVTGTKNASATDYYVALDGFLVGSATKVVQESALAIQYDKWVGKTQTAASGGSYRLNASTGDATFDFNGPAVTFVTARGPSYGKVNVIIDEFAVSSIVDLYAPNQQWQYAVEVSGLSNGLHTITIRPTHTKNANSSGYGVVLDAFEGIFNASP